MAEPLYNADTAAAPIRRTVKACDACRKRKVRCRPIAGSACQQCSHLNIPCNFSASPSKRSRKSAAPRGTIIASCRTSTTPIAQMAMPSPTGSHMTDFSSPISMTSPTPTSHPTNGAFYAEASFFLGLLPDYVETVYPVNPVIPEHEIRACIDRMHTDSEALAFLYAFASVTINLSHVDHPPEIRDQISALLVSSFEHRKHLTHFALPPSVVRIMTDVFTEIVLMGLSKPDLGLYYLHNAIAQLHMLPITDRTLPPTERLRRERLYWECFIHERFAAISFDRPVLLDPLPHLPDADPTIPFAIHQGWIYTIQTFKLIDRDFVTYWLRHGAPTPEWVRQRHRELEDDQWKMEVSMLPAMQRADIIVTRQWLRTTLWQMAISNVILTTDPGPNPEEDDGMSLTLPLRLSHELKTVLEGFKPIEVGVHGSGILHKLFEITNAIVDVIMQLPDAPDEDTRERIRDLLFLKKLMFGFPRMNRVHKRLLEQKFDMLRGMQREDEGVGRLVDML